MKDYVFRLDVFSQPIMLYYQNDYKYRSGIGLCLSVSFYLFVLVYFVYGVIPLWTDNTEFQYVSKSTIEQ